MEKILLIEDDKAYIENVKILLEEEGYNVAYAENGMDGIEIAKKESPGLIICDIMLPDVDGLTILKELRKREKTRLIPFIFLTARAAMTDLREGMNLGADDYLTKPFHSKDILAAVKTRLEKSKMIAIKSSGSGITANNKLGIDEYIFLPSKDNYESVPVSSIVCILSEGVYSNVFTNEGKKILVRKLLREWEESLPEKVFLRIHKSSLINLRYVKRIEKWFNGSLKVFLNNYNEPVIVSRRYAANVKKIL